MEDNYRIQSLLETKDFDALTNDERIAVLQQITREEYIARRQVVQSARGLFAQNARHLEPGKAVKLLLTERLKAKKRVQPIGMLWQIFNYRMPVWIPGLSFVLLLVLFLYREQATSKLLTEAAKKPSQIIYKTKTITVEKKVPEYITQQVVRYIEKKEPEHQVVTAVEPMPELLPVSTLTTFNAEQCLSQINNAGIPNSEEQDLNKFLVVAR